MKKRPAPSVRTTWTLAYKRALTQCFHDYGIVHDVASRQNERVPPTATRQGSHASPGPPPGAPGAGPALLHAVFERTARELPGLRLLYVGGEELPSDVAARWAPGRLLENGYGPTECSVTVVRAPVRAGEPVTIGWPVEGNHAWVLDESLEETEPGTAGELCIGGAGLARGYLNQPALTAERFVQHPRLGRIYRTGDLVERRSSGALAYLGRSDSQVKIRGHRVESGCAWPGGTDCDRRRRAWKAPRHARPPHPAARPPARAPGPTRRGGRRLRRSTACSPTTSRR